MSLYLLQSLNLGKENNNESLLSIRLPHPRTGNYTTKLLVIDLEKDKLILYKRSSGEVYSSRPDSIRNS